MIPEVSDEMSFNQICLRQPGFSDQSTEFLWSKAMGKISLVIQYQDITDNYLVSFAIMSHDS